MTTMGLSPRARMGRFGLRGFPMRPSELRLIGVIGLVGAFAVLGVTLALAYQQPASETDGMMGGGMMGGGGMLGPTGLLLVIVAIILIVFAVIAIFLPSGEQAGISSGSPPPPQAPLPPPISPPPQAAPSPPLAAPAAATPTAPSSSLPEGDRLLLLLEGDERRLFMRIQERGGVVLQKDLVTSSAEFSKAKVTRLLDKLERKGLVARERAGMTNRIRIVPPEQRST